MECPRYGSIVNLIGAREQEILRDKLQLYPRICITGASGWIGKEASDLLLRTLGSDFQNRVTLVTSKGQNIFLRSGSFATSSWNNFIQKGDFDLIIHFAFLNQERVNELGVDLFIEMNRKITSDVLSVASRNLSGDILAASSGAAKSYKSDLKSKSSYEVYAGIKNEMESRFISSSNFRHLGLMRIWNISGIYAKLEAPYALSSFISQALRGDTIQLNGAPDALRTYVNAQEMIWVYLMSLGTLDYFALDSGGFTIKLIDLARLVSSAMGNKQVVSKPVTPSSLVNYTPDVSKFNSLASDFSFALSNMQEQVDILAEFHGGAL